MTSPARSTQGRPPSANVVDEDGLIESFSQFAVLEKRRRKNSLEASATDNADRKLPEVLVLDLGCYADQERTNIPNLVGLVSMSPWLLIFLPHWPNGMAKELDVKRVLATVHEDVPLREPGSNDAAWLKWLAQRIAFLIGHVRFCIQYPDRIEYRLQLLSQENRETLDQMCACLHDVVKKESDETVKPRRRDSFAEDSPAPAVDAERTRMLDRVARDRPAKTSKQQVDKPATSEVPAAIALQTDADDLEIPELFREEPEDVEVPAMFREGPPTHLAPPRPVKRGVVKRMAKAAAKLGGGGFVVAARVSA